MLDRIRNDIKEAMKAGDKLKTSTLRMIVSDIKNLQIEKGGVNTELQESDLLTVLQRNVKKRVEAAKAFDDAERSESAEKELAEAAIIKAYLPEEISEEDLATAVDEAIAESGATSKREMGLVMKIIMAKYKGRADGKTVQQIVMKKLP